LAWLKLQKEVKRGYGEGGTHSRNEYLRVIRESYFKARTKKEKTQLLNEYCRNTDNRKKSHLEDTQGGS
jgi:hypothetical protein